MPIVSALGAMSSRGFGEFAQSSAGGKYIEDYFVPYLYTGSSSRLLVNTGVPLADTASWSSIKLQQNTSYGYGVAIDSGGNVYTAGRANDGSRSYGLLAKYSSSGTLQWQRKLYDASNSTTTFYDIGIDSSDNLYLCATSQNSYLYLIKYNSSGTIQWQRRLTETGTYGRGIAVSSAGNAYVAGYNDDGSRTHILIAKYDSSGTIQWQRKLYQGVGASSSIGAGNCIALDSSENVVVGGQAYDGAIYYGLVAKYNSSGTIQWQRKFHGGPGLGGGIRAVTVDSSNNVYATGTFSDGSTIVNNIIKYNSSGTAQWQRKFYTDSSLNAWGLRTDSSNNLYTTGSGYSTYLGGFPSGHIAKYNSSGVLQWQRYVSERDGQLQKAAVDSSGNIYATGFSTSNSVNYSLTSKLKTDGTTISGNAFASMIVADWTDAAGTATDAAGTATDAAGTATDSAGTLTDTAGTATSSFSSQPAVSSGGGLVWIKRRDTTGSNGLFDTVRGANYVLVTNATSSQSFNTETLNTFLASGFSLGTASPDLNTNGGTYQSWSFNQSQKFFKIVTYTGNGVAGRTVSHGLGSVPGMIIVKALNSTASWQVYHRSLGATKYLQLNLTGAPATSNTRWNNTEPTSTQLTLGSSSTVNGNGVNYVAYVFAHDAGGFGLSGSDNAISCGSFTADSSGQATVTLGYEPQFVLLKDATSTDDWFIMDTSMGWNQTFFNRVSPNLNVAESQSDKFYPTATGFVHTNLTPNYTYVYMAIRRGPMKVPTDATKVYANYYRSGTGAGATSIPSTALSYSPDLYLGLVAYSGSGYPHYFVNRLADQWSLQSDSTNAENFGPANPLVTFSGYQGQVRIGAAGLVNSAGVEIVDAYIRRAPSFMDFVCYTGTGSARTVTHNLGVAPELMIIKGRNAPYGWIVYSSTTGATKGMRLDNTGAAFSTSPTSSLWNDTAPTSTSFSLKDNSINNNSGDTYVAYLFASCPGVSKAGSYTGTGTTQQINCGFTAGTRFLLIKRTDGSGGWYCWTSATGISTGNDPFMLLNSSVQISPSTDYIDPYAAGFEISSTAPAAVNANGGTFIFLAIA